MMSSSRPSTNEDAFNLTFVPFVATPMDVILLSDIESRTAPLGGIQVSVYGSFEFGFSENFDTREGLTFISGPDCLYFLAAASYPPPWPL